MAGNIRTEVISMETDSMTISNPPSSDAVDKLVFLPIDWTAWGTVVQAALAGVGIIGNFIVILMYKLKIRKKTPMNTMITGLAIADFLTAINLIPIPTVYIAPKNIFGEFLCRVIYPLNILFVCIVASIFTLTMMSIEQCLAVLFPIKNRLIFSRSRPKIILILVWVASVIVNLFAFIVLHRSPETGMCDLKFNVPWLQKANGIFLFLVEYFIPMVIMVVSHVATARRLRSQEASILRQIQQSIRDGRCLRANMDQSQVQGLNDARRQCMIIRARQKVLRMLFVVVMTFIICWTPNHIGFLLYNIEWVDSSYVHGPIWSLFLNLAFLNSCANPFIYTLSNPHFRQAIQSLWARSEVKNKIKEETQESNMSIASLSSSQMHGNSNI